MPRHDLGEHTMTTERIGMFYGSFFGNTERAAGDIKRVLESLAAVRIDVASIGSVQTAALLNYDKLLLGISTWDIGEWQYDWDAKRKALAALDMRGRTIALFGTGDQRTYASTFQDALGSLAKLMRTRGARLVGLWPDQGYEHDSVEALEDGYFLGLALDNDNQEHLTQERIARWCAQLVGELALPERARA
jgi:flavodoxin long chain